MSKELTHADTDPAFDRFRCNERTFGCQQMKMVNDFSHQRASGRLNPDLCDSCLRHMEVSFGVNSKQVDLLVTVRHQEYSLICGAKELARMQGKDVSAALAVLGADKFNRLAGYTRKILEAFQKDLRPGVDRVWKAYQKWWLEQVGLDVVEKPKEQIAVIASNVVASAALPVGDR